MLIMGKAKGFTMRSVRNWSKYVKKSLSNAAKKRTTRALMSEHGKLSFKEKVTEVDERRVKDTEKLD